MAEHHIWLRQKFLAEIVTQPAGWVENSNLPRSASQTLRAFIGHLTDIANTLCKVCIVSLLLIVRLFTLGVLIILQMLSCSRIDLSLLALLSLNRLLLDRLLVVLLLCRLLIVLLLLLNRLLLHLLIVLLLRRLLLRRLLLYRLLLLRLLIVLLLRRLLWWGLSGLEIEPANFIGFRNPLQPFQEFNKVGRQLSALGVTIAIVQTVDPQSLSGIDNDLFVSLHMIGSSDEIFEGLTNFDVVLPHDAYLDLGAVFVDLLRFVVLLLDEGKIPQQIE